MKHAFRTMIKHLRRTPFQALAATSVLTITFFLIAVFSLVTTGSEVIIRHFESRPQVTAFFKDDAPQTAVSDLQSGINKIEGVTSTQYISKNKALELYREQNKKDPLLLEMVTADILPASLEVRASSPAVLSQIADIMKNNAIVEETVYQKDIVDNLIRWTGAIRFGGLALVFFLLSSSVLMVMVTISMKVASHKTEMEIIGLLGGSKGHIVAPFLLEGVFYGVVGGFIGWGLACIALLYATPLILGFMGAIPLLPVPIWIMLLLLSGQLLLGVSIGFFSSTLAARRFLK